MSFTLNAKKTLCALKAGKICCEKALLYGMMLCSPECGERIRFVSESHEAGQLYAGLLAKHFKIITTLSSYKRGKSTVYRLTAESNDASKHFFAAENASVPVCGNCQSSLLRGIFIACGRLSDPERGYMLEFAVKTQELCSRLEPLLWDAGFAPKISVRRGDYILYFKESEAVEDLLAFIGASKAALSLIETKIVKELRNDTNRRSNCETANMEKAIAASMEQASVIKKLTDSPEFDMLPAALAETARLRVANPSASISELAAMHSSPMSKSGVCHRLRKLIRMANGSEPLTSESGNSSGHG